MSLSVAAAADYQTTVLADTPLAFYPLNLTVDTGATATDISGNGNNGALVNISSGLNGVAGPSTFIPHATSFDGVSSYVDLAGAANAALLNFGGAITLEAWVQPANSTKSLMDIIAKGYDSTSDYDENTLRANGGNYYGGTYSGTHGVQGASGGLQATNWTHVVIVHDGAAWHLYVNGALVQTSTDATGALNWGAPWRIGTGSADGANRYFAGDIAQAAIYNHGLTYNQVLAHFFVGLTGLTPSNSAPIITVQPQPQSTYVGGTVTFSVTAVSPLAITNQWFKGASPLVGQTNKTLTLLNAQSGDVAGYSVVVGNSNGTTQSVVAPFGLLTPGGSLQWSANANSGVWDTGTSPNWINLANSQQVVFGTSDQVLFDDAVGAPTTVSINASVAPSLVTVNSSVNEFTFSGTGPLTGSGSLLKRGTSTLTLNVAGGFTGTTTISGGTVKTAGQGTLNSSSTIVVTNGGTLDFSGNAISQAKPVTLSGAGVGATGALFNSGAAAYGNVLNITLTGDATFGDSSVDGGTGRWDLGNGSSLAGPHKLSIVRAGNGGYAEWDSVNVGAEVGDIELVVGKLGIKNMSTSFGSPASTFIVDGNSEFDFWSGGCSRSIRVLNNGLLQIFSAPSAFNANLTLEDGARLSAFWGSGTQPMNGAVTLNGIAHLVLGDANFAFTNIISGSGGFVWDAYNHQMILSARNTYTGPTVIGNGQTVALSGAGSIDQSTLIFFGGNASNSVHLDVTGRTDQTLTLSNGQTLGGVGAVAGNLVVSAGALLSPAGTNTTIGITAGANPVGTIFVTSNLTLSGVTQLKLNGPGTNDSLQAAGHITYGGTLDLVNVSGAPLVAGDSFNLFGAATYSGSFTALNPATPGTGLAWDLSRLNSGLIAVIVAPTQPVINATVFSSGSLVFRGTNGAANGNYYVLSSTNVTTPLANWTTIATNSFDAAGGFSVTNVVSPGTPRRFYRLKLP